MRLVSLTRFRYGLRWPGKYPPIPWRTMMEGILFTVVLILVLMFVDYKDRSAVLSDRATIAERQRIQAEANLAHCLNGRSLTTDGGMVMCSKAHWVEIGSRG